MGFDSGLGPFHARAEAAPTTLPLPDVPWEKVAARLEGAALSAVRLDARLEASGLAAGWVSRCDMTESVRAILLDGHLVDIGDVVLHDAGMDVRSPTHELTRAAAALRARRLAVARRPSWPLSIDGLAALRGIGPVRADERGAAPYPNGGDGPGADEGEPAFDDDDPLAAQFAEIDALLDRTSKVLAGESPLPSHRPALVYDPEADDGESEDAWLDLVRRTAPYPAVAAAAVAWDGWLSLNLYPRQPWLGLAAAASVLRARGLGDHLLPLAAGFRASRFRPQGREGGLALIEGFCSVVEEAVAQGQKDLDRLVLARDAMERVTRSCRSNSRLPDLVGLFLSRPLVTVPLAAKVLDVTPKAIDLMLAQLGGARPRELTGRVRYRAWGIV